MPKKASRCNFGIAGIFKAPDPTYLGTAIPSCQHPQVTPNTACTAHRDCDQKLQPSGKPPSLCVPAAGVSLSTSVECTTWGRTHVPHETPTAPQDPDSPASRLAALEQTQLGHTDQAQMWVGERSSQAHPLVSNPLTYQNGSYWDKPVFCVPQFKIVLPYHSLPTNGLNQLKLLRFIFTDAHNTPAIIYVLFQDLLEIRTAWWSQAQGLIHLLLNFSAASLIIPGIISVQVYLVVLKPLSWAINSLWFIAIWLTSDASHSLVATSTQMFSICTYCTYRHCKDFFNSAVSLP